MGVGAFGRLEMNAGFNHNPDGLLADLLLRPHVRPTSSLTYDPMHCLWFNGVVGVELHCLHGGVGVELRVIACYRAAITHENTR